MIYADLLKITTEEEARQYAIDWQLKQSNGGIFYSELAEQQEILQELAERFDLVEEFTENGII